MKLSESNSEKLAFHPFFVWYDNEKGLQTGFNVTQLSYYISLVHLIYAIYIYITFSNLQYRP